MHLFESILVFLFGAVALTALARRIGAPYPTFLALGGAALSLVPGAPSWTLDPELTLALFLAPVLLDAAYDTSVRDLKDNWVPVTMLVLVAVGLTTVVVALVARWLVPSMPWAVAIALGAIVAPPDAAAAGAVLRESNLPHRLVTILEGESLFNDASALLIYRIAVGVAVGSTTVTAGTLVPTLLWVVVGSVVVGVALSLVVTRIIRRVTDAPSSIILQFASTFAVWILAERLGLSGILTVVAYAITAARSGGQDMPARLRVPSFAVWDTVIFMLNVLAFVIIGLQIGPLLAKLSASERVQYAVFAGAIVATVIVVRLAWCMGYTAVIRRRRASPTALPDTLQPTAKSGFIIGWTGMRGIVTLAAAFALPAGFPHRELILLSAFCVVLGTLVLQGLTLKPLLRWFDFDDGAPVAREVAAVRTTAYRAALATFDGDESVHAQALRREYTGAIERAETEDGEAPDLPGSDLRRRALAAAREAAVAAWRRGEIGDAAYHRIQEELDWAELSLPSARN